MPALIKPCGGGGSSAPWAIATQADYIPDDYFIGRAPNPLSYANFTTTDATAFDFVTTNVPAAGNGNVRILGQGLYLARLVISSVLRAAGSNPGYNWDMAVYLHGKDAGATLYFGPDQFHGTGVFVQPVASYATYINPRNNGGAPNGMSMLGRAEQHVETVSYLNLPDSVVDWPVVIDATFFHGLNDADVTVAPEYNLWLIRVADANPDASTA
jgi:hypothetical protein